MEVQPNRFRVGEVAACAGEAAARQAKRAPATVALPASDSDELPEEPAPKRAGGAREASQVFRDAPPSAAAS